MKGHIRSIVGIALSAILLWWTLRNVSLAVVWHTLEHSNLWYFLAATVSGTLVFPLRARRWQTILEPVAGKIPMGPLWRATAIGMMVNNTVPARAGEIARAYALTKEVRIPFSTSLASLAVDRVFDAIVVLLLASVALVDPAFPSHATIAGQSLSSWAAGSTLLVIVLLAILYSLVFFPRYLIWLFELFARKVAPSVEERGKTALIAFSDGLSVLRSPGRFLSVLIWTLAHWLLNAFAWWLGFKAVGIEVPYSAALLIQALIAVGVAVPSSPGFFGFFEKLGVVGLALYGIAPAPATSWAIGYHILTFIPITGIGAFYFIRLGLRFKELQRSAEGAAPSEAES